MTNVNIPNLEARITADIAIFPNRISSDEYTERLMVNEDYFFVLGVGPSEYDFVPVVGIGNFNSHLHLLERFVSDVGKKVEMVPSNDCNIQLTPTEKYFAQATLCSEWNLRVEAQLVLLQRMLPEDVKNKGIYVTAMSDISLPYWKKAVGVPNLTVFPDLCQADRLACLLGAINKEAGGYLSSRTSLLASPGHMAEAYIFKFDKHDYASRLEEEIQALLKIRAQLPI